MPQKPGGRSTEMKLKDLIMLSRLKEASFSLILLSRQDNEQNEVGSLRVRNSNAAHCVAQQNHAWKQFLLERMKIQPS
jgi:hypothetical protein